MHTIEHTLRLQNDKRTWPTIKQILETHCYTTLIVPTVKGPVINIRKGSDPDSDQKSIYQKLNINYDDLPIKKVIA